MLVGYGFMAMAATGAVAFSTPIGNVPPILATSSCSFSSLTLAPQDCHPTGRVIKNQRLTRLLASSSKDPENQQEQSRSNEEKNDDTTEDFLSENKDPLLPTNEDDVGDHTSLEWKNIGTQAKVFWEMAYPYYEQSKAGRWLFAGMIGLTLLNSGVSVLFSYLGKDFWNALSSKDVEEFYQVLLRYVGALLLGAPVQTLYRYQRVQLAVSWREWMTDRTLQLYSTRRVYYALERQRPGTADSDGIDNPDQRITEDVKSFTSFSLQLFLTILTSLIDLVSFSFILYSIYPQLFGAILAYAAFGTIVTTWLGQVLVPLNFAQLRNEADFRYSLLRLRENSESIAFYGGEDLEGKAIQQRLKKVMDNTRSINQAERNLEFFTTGYRYIIQILPVAVVAPKYFAGDIALGVVSQSVGAFNHILSDLSIIVNQFEQLSKFSAGIDRLSTFLRAMRDEDPERSVEAPLLVLNATANATIIPEKLDMEQEFRTIALQQMPRRASEVSHLILGMEKLDLCTPDRKRVLIRDLNLSLQQGENLLIVGNSGAGKSSLLRAIAGLWTAGNGSILRPNDEDVYFLPQRPYCTLGSLKDQLLYPSLEDADPSDYVEGHVIGSSHLLKMALTDEDLVEVLEAVDLKDVALRAGEGDSKRGLQAKLDWSNILSLGEQQRLAFGRLLVNRPSLVILDEATSALDMEGERRMYSLLKDMALGNSVTSSGALKTPSLTYISVGHRPSLLSYHGKKLRLGGENEHVLSDIETTDVGVAQQQVSNM